MVLSNTNKDCIWENNYIPSERDWKCFDHQFTADGLWGVAINPSHEWDGKGYRYSHQLLQYPLPFDFSVRLSSRRSPTDIKTQSDKGFNPENQFCPRLQ